MALLDLFNYTALAVDRCAAYGMAPGVQQALLSFPRERAVRWTRPEFYKRWIKNIARSVLFPNRDVALRAR